MGSRSLQAVSISLAPGSPQTDEQAQTTNVTATVSNDPATKGVTWSLNAGAKGALSGPTATAVTYNAPATITAASTDTITATSVFDNTKTQTLSINLITPPAVTTASLPNATEGSAYSQTVAASGGVSPYAFTVSNGTLPAGLNMSSSGQITGTPTGPNVASGFFGEGHRQRNS